MTRNSTLTGVLGTLLVLGLSLPGAPAAATTIDYTLTGTGSYEIGGGNTAGTFTFTFADTTDSAGPLVGLSAGTINLTPYFPEPLNPIYNGSFSSGSLVEVAGGLAFAVFTSDSSSNLVSLFEFPSAGVTLGTPFSVTGIEPGCCGAPMLGDPFLLADSKTFYLETLTSDVTFSAAYAVSATPLPAALPLFASGLGAMGLLGWRRKRKAAALAA